MKNLSQHFVVQKLCVLISLVKVEYYIHDSEILKKP